MLQQEEKENPIELSIRTSLRTKQKHSLYDVKAWKLCFYSSTARDYQELVTMY